MSEDWRDDLAKNKELYENWEKEYKSIKNLNPLQVEILDGGPKSLAQAWMIGAMYSDWKKIKGLTDPEPPDCQSSFKEWNSSIDKESQKHPHNSSVEECS